VRLLALVLAAAALAPAALARSPAPAFDSAALRVVHDGMRTELRVQVADTAVERNHGLMFRRTVAPYRGMLFVFPATSSGGFWMKNTLIPLSIAFADARGRIVRILDMVPCRRDPCPLYSPDADYRLALEVPRGDFRRLGVAVGDRLLVPRSVVAAAR
jgi:uncharacterized membrane protein (UPF0127 family)